MSPVSVPTIQLNNGQTIPQVGLGLFQVSDNDTERIVEQAIEVGYRHFDTASMYQNEQALGRAIARSGVAREEFFITSKLWNSDHERAGDALRSSLDLLGLDYLDLYLIHWPLPMHDTAVTAWRKLIQKTGSELVRSIGVSNFEIDHLVQLHNETGVVPAVNQIELHALNQRVELREYCRENGIAVEAWGPLGQGKTDILSLPEVVEAAEQLERTPAQVVLRWLVQQDVIVIPKTVHRDRLEENITLFDFKLSEAQMTALNSLDQQLAVGPNPYTFDRK